MVGIIININVLDFQHNYDVHAFRLCEGTQPSEITLADAMRHGEACQQRRSAGVFRDILFQGCSEYFHGSSNQDLTIYAYGDVDGCNGGLLYRFLLINGTVTGK
jgi:hypothetical protein